MASRVWVSVRAAACVGVAGMVLAPAVSLSPRTCAAGEGKLHWWPWSALKDDGFPEYEGSLGSMMRRRHKRMVAAPPLCPPEYGYHQTCWRQLPIPSRCTTCETVVHEPANSAEAPNWLPPAPGEMAPTPAPMPRLPEPAAQPVPAPGLPTETTSLNLRPMPHQVFQQVPPMVVREGVRPVEDAVRTVCLTGADEVFMPPSPAPIGSIPHPERETEPEFELPIIVPRR